MHPVLIRLDADSTEPHLINREHWESPIVPSLREVLTVVREGGGLGGTGLCHCRVSHHQDRASLSATLGTGGDAQSPIALSPVSLERSARSKKKEDAFGQQRASDGVGDVEVSSG